MEPNGKCFRVWARCSSSGLARPLSRLGLGFCSWGERSLRLSYYLVLNNVRFDSGFWRGGFSKVVSEEAWPHFGASLRPALRVLEDGDEILCYQGDYPANVYPWMEAERRGAKLRYLEPDEPGADVAVRLTIDRKRLRPTNA